MKAFARATIKFPTSESALLDQGQMRGYTSRGDGRIRLDISICSILLAC